MKKIEALAEYLGFMLSLDAQPLRGVHAPKTSLKRCPKIIAAAVKGD